MDIKRFILLLSVLISVATFASLSEAVGQRTYPLGQEGEFIRVVFDKCPDGKSLLNKEQSDLLSILALKFKGIIGEYLAEISSPEFSDDIFAESSEHMKLSSRMTLLAKEFCEPLRELKFTKEQLEQTFTRALIDASGVIAANPEEFNISDYKNRKFSKKRFDYQAYGLIEIIFKMIPLDALINFELTVINEETLHKIIREYVKLFISQNLLNSVLGLRRIMQQLSTQLEECVTRS